MRRRRGGAEKPDAQAFNIPLEEQLLDRDLQKNIKTANRLFKDDDTFILREISNRNEPELCYALLYCAGMIDQDYIGENIIKPLILSNTPKTADNTDGLIDTIIKQDLFAHGPKKADNFREIVEAVTNGDTVLLTSGANKALIMSTQGFPLRGVSEPDNEKALSGPKEGFGESLIINTSFIHRKLRTNDVKMRFVTFGRRSRTKACVCYMDGLVNKGILDELMRRLDTIDIDGVLDVNYLRELITDQAYSPYASMGSTERPDIVAAKLLEGRIALMLDGTPVVLTLPYLFIENFQSNEDYYMNFYYTGFSRMIRILGYFLTITVPGIYIAITAYHHEMLPTSLLISITRERQSVPFPMGFELVLMLLVFDVLRETGIRMPTGIGQAMSIVGALVLGQAAVAAKIASSLVIIVVALTGITSLLVPKLNAASIVMRVLILALSMVMGLPGFILGVALALTHILSLNSFGVPQTAMSGDLARRSRDAAVRAPIWQMTERPAFAADTRRFTQPRRWWR